MIYYEPVNIKQWNMFEKVSSIGYVEPFLATKKMAVGDTVLLHVGAQDRSVESGIYAVGTVVDGPFILTDRPEDCCNNKSTVMVRIDRIVYGKPLISHERCKDFIKQFRSVHRIDPVHYEAITEELA